MSFSFIIPSASGIVGSDTTIFVDKGAQIPFKPRVKLAKFGDGYEQRLADGINNIDKTISVSFSPREKAEIDDIVDYFAYLGGVASFTLTVPNTNGNETLKVVAEEWSKAFIYDDFYSARATLRKVNEA